MMRLQPLLLLFVIGLLNSPAVVSNELGSNSAIHGAATAPFLVAQATKSAKPVAKPVSKPVSKLVANQAPPSPTLYKPWQDPMLGGFSLMVPDNWIVRGGMVQPSPLDVRAELQTGSPDGDIISFMGDTKLPPFTMPNNMLNYRGFRLGSAGGPSRQLAVERYQTADTFLATYGPNRLNKICTNISTTSIQNQPALAATLATIYQDASVTGIRSRFTAAAGHFQGWHRGKPCIAYILLTVQGIFGGGPGTWLVPHIWGYVCAPASEPVANRVLCKMMSTFEYSPEWAVRTNEQDFASISKQSTRAMIDTVSAECKK